MSPERFRQIEELYHAARKGTAEDRAALLAQADPELRRELESLLIESDGGESLNRPAVQIAPHLLGDLRRIELTVGASLGPYRIESKIGEGGMGEVFRAIDTRLGRAIAIKTTREQFSARFDLEARAISSLNHPNICALYDVGPKYLVMELVEGETVAARLQSGPLPLKTALLYGSQILAALVEAHGKGIIHRDLKPGNIMIGKSGVKVLDFGLAKSGVDETVTSSQMIMGTPAYMAPEQRQGKPADARTDIYSFGCILYEMLTGARTGPRRQRIPSRRLERIVNRCLEENPVRRWQSATELERELAKVAAGTSPWKAAASAAAIVAVLALAYAYSHRPRKLTDTDTIVLADFDNKTGDPVLDDTLRQGLAIELQQSPFLSLISDARIRQMLSLMSQPRDARLTPEIALQICERTGSAAVLEGSIASLGSQYVLGLRAKDCKTGSVLDQEQIQVVRREDILNSLSQIARKFRARVGESLATVEQHSMPLSEATTSSLEALKAYSTGMKGIVSSGGRNPTAVIPSLRRAIEIDPQFAMAHAFLGFNYSARGESELSAESTTKGWLLRDRVSDREKFFIDFLYDRQVTGNLEKAYQTLELWLQTYPRGEDPNPQGLLGGIATRGTGRFERAIEFSRRRIVAEPKLAVGYSNLAGSYLFLGRIPEVRSTLQGASELKVENPELLVIRYNLAALDGDQAQMAQILALASGKRGAEHWLAHAEALGLARSGRLEAARRSSSRAMDLAVQEGDREPASTYQAARAVWESVCGNATEGKRHALIALQGSKGRDVQYAAGLALALSGETAWPLRVADELEKHFPEDTFVRFTYVPILRGLDALGRRKPAESVERLQASLRYEQAVNGLSFRFALGGLYSAYVRGQALMAARRYGEAVSEFQKIIDHRGIVGLDPIGALAHLQLGRAFALSGDKSKAKSAYDGFLTLWKDADSDLAVLKQAKAEYAKLL